MRSESDHRFVIYVDLEGYSKTHDEAALRRMTEAVCQAAQMAANAAAWSNGAAFQCTGDGFIAAPADRNAKAIAQFIRSFSQLYQAFSSTAVDLSDVRPRIGVDYGPLFIVSTFGSPNVAGSAAVVASRVGSLGDGGNVLLSRSAVEHLGNALVCEELGEVPVKHGTKIFVHQCTEAWCNVQRPARTVVRGTGLFHVHTLLREVGLAVMTELIARRHVDADVPETLGSYPSRRQALQAAEKHALRVSVLVEHGAELRVPGELRPDGSKRSLFRYGFGDAQRHLGQGTSRFAIGEGLPGFVYAKRVVKGVYNLPPDKDAWIIALSDKTGAYAHLNYDATALATSSRCAPNMIALPVQSPTFADQEAKCVGVVTLDFEGRCVFRST